MEQTVERERADAEPSIERLKALGRAFVGIFERIFIDPVVAPLRRMRARVRRLVQLRLRLRHRRRLCSE